MNVLFVVPYPVGMAASQRFRVEQLLPLLKQEDISCKVAPFWDGKPWAILYKPGNTVQKVFGVLKGFAKRVMLLKSTRKYDFIFIHREATPVGPPWFEWIVSSVLGKKIIFDMDDALWLPNTTDTNAIAAKFKQHHKVESVIKWSYRVSCGNNYLLDYARHFNSDVVLLPTTVESTNYNHLRALNRKIVIGWIGSHSTLPYLELIEPVLQRLEKEFDFDFVVIADKKPDLKLKAFIFIPWRKETEIEDMLKLNIGVMPLPDTEWAKGKCAFKAIQYMALGIPAVVSAVGANIEAVPAGITGFVCSSEEEWYLRLKELLQNADLRATMGQRGQEWIKHQYSVEAYKATFLKLFT